MKKQIPGRTISKINSWLPYGSIHLFTVEPKMQLDENADCNPSKRQKHVSKMFVSWKNCNKSSKYREDTESFECVFGKPAI